MEMVSESLPFDEITGGLHRTASSLLKKTSARILHHLFIYERSFLLFSQRSLYCAWVRACVLYLWGRLALAGYGGWSALRQILSSLTSGTNVCRTQVLCVSLGMLLFLLIHWLLAYSLHRLLWQIFSSCCGELRRDHRLQFTVLNPVISVEPTITVINSFHTFIVLVEVS